MNRTFNRTQLARQPSKPLASLPPQHTIRRVLLKPCSQADSSTAVSKPVSSQVSDLKPLEQLKNLNTLALTLSGMNKEKDLEVFLGQFPKFELLSLAGLSTEQRRSLHKILASVVELKF